MLSTMVKYRKVPKLLDRSAMLEMLLHEEYGYLPPAPDSISYTSETMVKNFCASKATFDKIELTCKMGDKSFTFPVYCVIPAGEGKYPFFVHINFRDDVPDRYMPTEELVDNGFAVLSFCYKDVTSDDGDFTDGLAGVLYEDGKRGPTDAGKIAMWAWAAHRVLDLAENFEALDMTRAIVCGHSRLGKTALLAGATDERVFVAHSNDSGCSGAAITRDKDGEKVSNITTRFPYWFCENYYKYADNEQAMPFDQHFLIACNAPHCVSVASAKEDVWADPVSEMLGCFTAKDAWGEDGFICEDRLPQAGDEFFDGKIGYFLRAGSHYFSREDWLKLIKFINKKTN